MPFEFELAWRSTKWWKSSCAVQREGRGALDKESGSLEEVYLSSDWHPKEIDESGKQNWQPDFMDALEHL